MLLVAIDKQWMHPDQQKLIQILIASMTCADQAIVNLAHSYVWLRAVLFLTEFLSNS